LVCREHADQRFASLNGIEVEIFDATRTLTNAKASLAAGRVPLPGGRLDIEERVLTGAERRLIAMWYRDDSCMPRVFAR
jgi:hypothetical protein